MLWSNNDLVVAIVERLCDNISKGQKQPVISTLTSSIHWCVSVPYRVVTTTQILYCVAIKSLCSTFAKANIVIMSMYKFVKGSRLFMQGSREKTDYDNVHDTFHPTVAGDRDRARGGYVHRDEHDQDDIRAVHTMRTMHVDGTTEWEKSGHTVRKGGVKTRSSRTVRKVTTVTRGEQSVTSESVMSYASDNARRYPGAITADKKSLKFRVLDDQVNSSSTERGKRRVSRSYLLLWPTFETWGSFLGTY